MKAQTLKEVEKRNGMTHQDFLYVPVLDLLLYKYSINVQQDLISFYTNEQTRENAIFKIITAITSNEYPVSVVRSDSSVYTSDVNVCISGIIRNVQMYKKD
ncbi:hypothetical protein C7H19_25095 [Aphanothece hegewaldii CCALA 016]|uniref:Uncharacterized protein n=1 Tax=Aphanothece hegewaldii CCALA 016 TaxID=2107694 RepID=A0A2T1LQA6_9CHRO|nr:hypothetical protein C7H19_25095 [Aphanothece hegewaldii CCALA 016]